MKKHSREKNEPPDCFKSGDLVSVSPTNKLTGYVIPAAMYMGSEWVTGDDQVPYAVYHILAGGQLIYIRAASHKLMHISEKD